MTKIENFVEDLDFSKLDTKELLTYLKLASIYGFAQAEHRLVNQIKENFLKLQMYQEFTWLNIRTKVLLARKRLWTLLKDFQERPYLLNTQNVGLLSLLADYEQMEFSFGTSNIFNKSASPSTLLKQSNATSLRGEKIQKLK